MQISENQNRGHEVMVHVGSDNYSIRHVYAPVGDWCCIREGVG